MTEENTSGSAETIIHPAITTAILEPNQLTTDNQSLTKNKNHEN